MGSTRRKSAGAAVPSGSGTTAERPGGEPDAVTVVERRRQAARRAGGTSFLTRRNELLAVAAHVFRERGLSGVSLGDIAERAGVDRATIYYYFRSKEELFKDLIEDVVTRNVEDVERIADLPEAPAARLRLAIEALLVSFARHEPYAAVYVEEFLARNGAGTAAGDFEDVRKLGRRYDRAMRRIVREGIEAGLFRPVAEERTVAAMIVGLMNSTVRWNRTTSVEAARRTAAAMSDLVLGGLEAG